MFIGFYLSPSWLHRETQRLCIATLVRFLDDILCICSCLGYVAQGRSKLQASLHRKAFAWSEPRDIIFGWGTLTAHTNGKFRGLCRPIPDILNDSHEDDLVSRSRIWGYKDKRLHV